ncbi:hypothetical protein NPIL_694641 [Nephila pilipes]|uniref:Uncharacterized protein n=1 Tax=Nephila pilipes TaxID=299642 RepID=A0A8X6P6Q0_NEPPI|nr:hypothetical protein NPIL_694641 [Nephila pilipes]
MFKVHSPKLLLWWSKRISLKDNDSWANIAKYIPFLIIGLVALTASLCATLLPETLDEILPQTIQDGETFGKDQKYFMCKWKRTKHSKPSKEDEYPKGSSTITANIENL